MTIIDQLRCRSVFSGGWLMRYSYYCGPIFYKQLRYIISVYGWKETRQISFHVKISSLKYAFESPMKKICRFRIHHLVWRSIRNKVYQKVKYYSKPKHLAKMESLKYRFLITSGPSFPWSENPETILWHTRRRTELILAKEPQKSSHHQCWERFDNSGLSENLYNLGS